MVILRRRPLVVFEPADLFPDVPHVVSHHGVHLGDEPLSPYLDEPSDVAEPGGVVSQRVVQLGQLRAQVQERRFGEHPLVFGRVDTVI